MTIVALKALQDNYIWGVTNESNRTLFCFDPGVAEPVLNYATKNHLVLTHILLTHHHNDHIGGIKDLLKAFPDVSIVAPIDSRILPAHIRVRDENIIHIDHYDFRIMYTPGHTNTHICYQEVTNNWLFCGDTLFSGGCGRVFDGTMEQLFHSLQLIKMLPDITQIYCAHEYTQQNLKFAATIEPGNETIPSYLERLKNTPSPCSLPSTLALEKKINPFLRTSSPELQQFAQQLGINPDNEFLIFKNLREQKDNFRETGH